MKTLAEIRAQIEARAVVIDAREDRLPTYGLTEDSGRPHIAVDAATYSYVIVERGQVQSRFDTPDLDALLERVFTDVTFGEAIDFELARRDERQDFRRIAFARQIELLARLSPAWAEHRRQRIEEILQEHPFDDDALLRARAHAKTPHTVGRTSAFRRRLAWLLSFRRAPGTWRFRDYPYTVSEAPSAPAHERFRVVGAGVAGQGATLRDALADAQCKLEAYPHPQRRPGARMRVVFADTNEIAAFGDLVDEFIERVLHLPSRPIFVSNLSTLADFPDEPPGSIDNRLRIIYNIDPDALVDRRLVTVLTAIFGTPKT